MKQKIYAILLGVALPLLALAGLETGTYISDLVTTNPTGSDNYATADDHIRLLKTTIKNTWPNVNNAVTLTDEQFNTGIPLLASSNTFTGNDQTISSSSPTLRLHSTGAAVDQKRWRFLGGSTGTLSIDTMTDANAFGENLLVATRTGTAITRLTLATGSAGTFALGATAISAISGVEIGQHLLLNDSNPSTYVNESDAPLNEKLWRWSSQAGNLQLQSRTDVNGGGATPIDITRTGTVIDSFAIASTAFTWNGNTLFTTANDGSASGFDADLLDGQSSAFYQSAANLNAGTLPDARFPATLPALSGVNLTALNMANAGSGTLAIARGGTGQTDGTTRNITGKTGVAKTLSTSGPSGGADGDIWYRY